MPRATSGAFPCEGVADVVRHAGDAARVLYGGDPRWTDALLSETRAHLAGCLNAVELAIGLELDGGWLARPVAALGPNYGRIAIENRPELLSPLLLDHLRHRAAAALALRLTVHPHSDPLEEPAESASLSAPVADARVALNFSVDPWFAVHPLDRPMRADLLAEPFCDLVWTAAALLTDGLAGRMGIDPASACLAMARAAATIIARHDEQSGPFARAAYVAAIAHDDGERRALAAEAAMRRDLLLLAALGAREGGMPLERAMTIFLDGADADRAALAHSVGLDERAYIALLDMLAPFHAGDADGVLATRIAQYRLLTAEQSAERLMRWRGPAPLIDKLARIGWGAA